MPGLDVPASRDIRRVVARNVFLTKKPQAFWDSTLAGILVSLPAETLQATSPREAVFG
jgi:hypothetical protein